MTWDTVGTVMGVVLGIAIGLWAILVLNALWQIRDHLKTLKNRR